MEFGADRVEHSLHAMLGAAVGRLQRDAAIGKRRPDQYDAASVSRQHPFKRGPCAVHCAVIADIRHALVLIGLDVDKLGDRKSTRLNSSHVAISYAVLC